MISIWKSFLILDMGAMKELNLKPGVITGDDVLKVNLLLLSDC